MMCLPFQHEYGKWSEAIPNSMNSFSMNRQTRVCAECGKIVVRRIWWSGCCFFSAINDALKEGKG